MKQPIQKAGDAWRRFQFTETGRDDVHRVDAYATNQAERHVTVESIWTEYDAKIEGCDGMLIHSHLTCADLQNEDLQAIAFFYHDDGALKPVESQWHEFRTADGALCVAERFSPPFRRTLYRDFQLFLPFDALHFRGDGIWHLKYELVIRSTEPRWQVLARSPWQHFEFR